MKEKCKCPRCGGVLGDTTFESRRRPGVYVCLTCNRAEEHFDRLLEVRVLPDSAKEYLREMEAEWLEN